ncbi:succinate dehydrogenase assembly factor 2 [Alphaproteobacteria bacterium]|nr:succinate dehydrogenase assembly factor 2 [Alphaproteobacteria bacterium]
MKLNSLKKIIKYRSSYSGTKETDIMYERYFIRNLEKFNKYELNLLLSVFDYYSDDLIFQILTKKTKPNNKFKSLFDRIDKI